MFENIDLRISKKYFAYLIVFSAINILLISLLFPRFGAVFASDSQEYVITAKYLAGQAELVSDNMPKLMGRLLKPVFPALIAVLSPVFGFRVSFIVINAIFYLFAGFIVFKITKILFKDESQSFIASLFFLTAYPMLEYGINYYTDLAGWFFFILSVYLTLLFLRRPSYILASMGGLFMSLGMLIKEYAAPGALFFIICLLFVYKDTFISKLKYLGIYLLCLLIPFGLWQIFVYCRYSYSYYDWYLLSRRGTELFKQNYFKIISKSIVGVFLLGWVFVLLGLLKIKEISSSSRKIIYALILPSFSFLLWTGVSSRLFYILGLSASLLASWGVAWASRNFNKYYVYTFFGLAIAANYFWFIFDDRLRIFINNFLSISY